MQYPYSIRQLHRIHTAIGITAIRIEELVGCPITLVSTSPKREDVILVSNPFGG